MKKNLLILSMALFSLPIFSQSSNDDTVYRRADVMPVFQQCQLDGFENNPYSCTITQLSNYFLENVQIDNPTGNTSKGVLSFIVETDGSISDINLVRSVYLNPENSQLQSELDSKILELANSISFLSPGMNGDESVRIKVQFSVPVNY